MALLTRTNYTQNAFSGDALHRMKYCYVQILCILPIWCYRLDGIEEGEPVGKLEPRKLELPEQCSISANVPIT